MITNMYCISMCSTRTLSLTYRHLPPPPPTTHTDIHAHRDKHTTSKYTQACKISTKAHTYLYI